uniref:Uncharacterized protein n=1 Tax=Arundo donax TaxID=35708 RepID=A0A0A8YIA8_ARUDO
MMDSRCCHRRSFGEPASREIRAKDEGSSAGLSVEKAVTTEALKLEDGSGSTWKVTAVSVAL